MKPRIFLLHAYRYSMAPCEEAFQRLWPEAEAIRLLDESLYADAGADGSLPANIGARLSGLFRHCVASGARGIVFTGSTFGPAVEAAKDGIDVPLLKADEAMSEMAVAKGRRILILATAKRAMPVIRRNLQTAAKAAGVAPEIVEAWVPDAQAANNEGRADFHDRAIAEMAVANGTGFDAIVLGQMSMAPARRLMAASIADRVLTSPDAAAIRMRALLASRG
jgi:Asp/Glu/hydantoin racemase